MEIGIDQYFTAERLATAEELGEYLSMPCIQEDAHPYMQYRQIDTDDYGLIDADHDGDLDLIYKARDGYWITFSQVEQIKRLREIYGSEDLTLLPYKKFASRALQNLGVITKPLPREPLKSTQQWRYELHEGTKFEQIRAAQKLLKGNIPLDKDDIQPIINTLHYEMPSDLVSDTQPLTNPVVYALAQSPHAEQFFEPLVHLATKTLPWEEDYPIRRRNAELVLHAFSYKPITPAFGERQFAFYADKVINPPYRNNYPYSSLFVLAVNNIENFDLSEYPELINRLIAIYQWKETEFPQDDVDYEKELRLGVICALSRQDLTKLPKGTKVLVEQILSKHIRCWDQYVFVKKLSTFPEDSLKVLEIGLYGIIQNEGIRKDEFAYFLENRFGIAAEIFLGVTGEYNAAAEDPLKMPKDEISLVMTGSSKVTW